MVFTVFTASAFMYFVFSAFVEGRNVLQNTALPGWSVQVACVVCRRGVDVAATRSTPGSA